MLRYVTLACCAVFLAGCGNQSTVPVAEAPSATVFMRDGTRLQGKVIASSPKEIKIANADNTTQTIPMSLVKSVEYAEAAPAPATSAPATAAGTPATAASVPAPPPAAADPPAPPHEEHPHPTEAAITSTTRELPVGTEISVRTEETIDSGKTSEGQTFAAEVTRSVKDSAGGVVIPRGSNASIIIRSASKGGKIRGAADLVLDLASVSVDGVRYRLSTVDHVEKGHQGVGANKRTGEFAGGGAAVGAIIGAIAGGGKGAAIGAGSGAGAGVLTQVLTKGGSIKVPVESVLTFRLDRPLKVQSSQ